MPWNWELPDWPKFNCNFEKIAPQERQFLLGVGGTFAFLKNIQEKDHTQFIIEILSTEGLESSKIEGEILDRESLQSSIKQQFGLHSPNKKKTDKEMGMAQVLCDVYRSFDQPLSHQMLGKWHSELFNGATHITDQGIYRTHDEPMQIVSNRYGSTRIFFEAPPSKKISREMDAFVDWFNRGHPSETILGRAAIAHIYFESVHPFEDGNGRLGRILVEKILSQGVGRPVLIAISKILEKRKKEYYAALEKCNQTLDVQDWIEFFAQIILEGQQESMTLLNFLIVKSKLLSSFTEKLNPRQEKALLRLFDAGPAGFKGGLSSENYIAITKASRATATRDLTDLVEKGVLIKTGELRHTRYWLNLD